MSSNELHWLRPGIAPEIAEILAAYHLTREFHREVIHREEHQAYYQWYQEVAKQHQQELQKMRGDVNLFSLFRRRTG